MSFVSNLLGYILNYIYILVNNYGVAIIIFSILLQVILLPLAIKQQKTMKKTSKIQGKVQELQEKYKNDKSKLQQEMMELYKQENLSPFSGCLSSVIQILLLFAIFGLVRNPLTYMKKISADEIRKYKEEMNQAEVGQAINPTYPEISILKYVNTHKTPEDPLYINTNFFSLDLSNIPKENSNDFRVFIIPILYVITSMISMKITTVMTKKDKEEANKKQLDKKEETNKDELDKRVEEKDLAPDEMAQQMNKSMSWFMPIMAVSIAIIAPLGLALYWLVNNILMVTERLILNKVLKSEEEEEQQNG